MLPRKNPPIPANILLPNPPKAGRLVNPRLPKPDLLEPKEPKRERPPKDLLLKSPLEPLKPKLLIPPNLLASAIEPIYEVNSLLLLEKSVIAIGNEIKRKVIDEIIIRILSSNKKLIKKLNSNDSSLYQRNISLQSLSHKY
jgi:hypothetical protein